MHEDEYVEVYFRLNDEEDDNVLRVEHWFAERPAIETVAALLDEARAHYSELYPGVTVTGVESNVTRLRPEDHGRTRVEHR